MTISSITFIACEKEELPIQPFQRGNIETKSIETGNDYRYQVWFDLESGTEVGRILKNSWDLAFDATAEKGFIKLNGGKLCKAAISYQNWENTTSTAGLEFYADAPNGDTDSLAIGKWWEHQKIIVIDRGFDEAGNPLGFVKLELQSKSEGLYLFRYAALNGSNEQSISLPADTRYEELLFSFDTHTLTENVPFKDRFDLCFTQYTHVFYDPYTPYLVSGVLSSSSVVVSLDTSNSFTDINRVIAEKSIYSIARDAIGYNWKTYSFDTGSYIVNAKLAYLIRDRKGFYYKLHFIDFYNNKGEKGAPKFEYQRL